MACLVRSLAVATLVLSSTVSHAALQFTDWTSAGGNTATGVIGPVLVSLSGTYVGGLNLSGTSPVFSSPDFTPALPLSDWIEIGGFPGTGSYNIEFSRPVVDPVIHLASLASTITFAEATPTRVSGDATFVVAGNTVSGTASGSTDSNGTVQLPGVFSSISFTASYAVPPGDGIAIQIGVDPLLPVPEPGAAALMALGLAWLALPARRRKALLRRRS